MAKSPAMVAPIKVIPPKKLKPTTVTVSPMQVAIAQAKPPRPMRRK